MHINKGSPTWTKYDDNIFRKKILNISCGNRYFPVYLMYRLVNIIGSWINNQSINQSINLQDPDLHVLIRAVLFELHCQSLTVQDRSRILDLVQMSLCPARLEALVASPLLAGQMVHGFLQCVEGETHPRNLAVIFGCWPILLQRFDCDIFIEDIFEVLSCYFPIDFNQPKNNPYSVTKADLSQGLEARYVQEIIDQPGFIVIIKFLAVVPYRVLHNTSTDCGQVF